MIDPNLYQWRNIDWQAELNSYMEAFKNPRMDEAQLHALRIGAGRCIVLMQEYLSWMDWEYIMHCCALSHRRAHIYQQTYLAYVKEQLEAQS